MGLGACLLTALSIDAFTAGDISRVASSVVIGIGFIGAGIIVIQEQKVKGLTSAATVWVVAAIGIAFGAGYYVPALAAAAIQPLSGRAIRARF